MQILLFASFLFAAAPRAERSLERVEITGNRVISTTDALEIFSWAQGAPWSVGAESTAVVRLLERYASLGYIDAAVTVTRTPGKDEDAVRVSLAVSEGEYRPLTRLAVEGADLLGGKEAARLFRGEKGKPIDPSRLEERGEEILRWYARRGHPFGRLVVSAVTDEREPPGVGVTFRLVEGPFVTLGDLTVTGNRLSRVSTVKRLSGLRFGEPYDQEAVDRCVPRLLRSGLFRSVSPPVTRVNWKEKEAVIELAVREAPSNRIEGIFGYAPGTDGEKGVLSGYVDIAFRNLFGTARRGEIHWERIAPGTRSVRLAYREPWFLGTPLGVGGKAEQTLRDSSWSRTSASLLIDFESGGRLSSRFAVGSEKIKPRDEAGDVPRSIRRWGSVGFTFDGTDTPRNPSSGFLLRFDPEYGERTVDAEPERRIEKSTSRLATMEGAFDLYRRVGGVVLAAEMNGRARFTSADRVPLYDQFYLGGAATLRGYDEDRFLGSRIAWGRFELRRLLGPLSRAFLFFDYGYIFARRERDGRIVNDEMWKRGVGLGIRLDSGIGVVGIDYGLGEGDGFMEGKIHVAASGDF